MSDNTLSPTEDVGLAVAGATQAVGDVRAVAVYRSPVPGSRVYVTPRFAQSKKSGGWLTFVPAGPAIRHPHNREAVRQSYGELCVWDPCIIEMLDAAIRSKTVVYKRVIDPQPIQATV